jgi:hypothetical protein
MRSNPTAAFDKSSQAQFHVNAAQAAKRLAVIALRPTSKRQAKKDKASIHKAKAWHCQPLHINTILRATKQSRITWI